MPPSNTRGFTLIEIMIVVGIIAILAAIAVPSYIRARERAQHTDFLNSIRVLSNAVEMYAAEYGQYPEDSNTGQLPQYFDTYIKAANWDKPPPIGGQWDHEFNENGVISAIGVHRYDVTDDDLRKIDRLGDDGNLSSGLLQKIANDRYYYVIQQ